MLSRAANRKHAWAFSITARGCAFSAHHADQQTQLDAAGASVPGHWPIWQAPSGTHGQRSHLQQLRVHDIFKAGGHSQANHACLCTLVQWTDRAILQHYQALAAAAGSSEHIGRAKRPSGSRLVLQPRAPAPKPQGLDAQGGQGWAGTRRSSSGCTGHAICSNSGWCALWVLDQALKRTSRFTELSAGLCVAQGINAPVGEESSKKQREKRRNHTCGCCDGARNCGFQPGFVKKRG